MLCWVLGGVLKEFAAAEEEEGFSVIRGEAFLALLTRAVLFLKTDDFELGFASSSPSPSSSSSDSPEPDFPEPLSALPSDPLPDSKVSFDFRAGSLAFCLREEAWTGTKLGCGEVFFAEVGLGGSTANFVFLVGSRASAAGFAGAFITTASAMSLFVL